MKPNVHKTSANTVNPSTTHKPPKEVNTYHGNNPNGSFRAVKDGAKVNVFGSMYLRCLIADGLKKPKTTLRKIAATPGYENIQGDQVISFIAVCLNTQESYRIKGKVVKCKVTSQPDSTAVSSMGKVIKSKDNATTFASDQFGSENNSLAHLVSTAIAPAPQTFKTTPKAFAASAIQKSADQKKRVSSERQLVMFKREVEIVVAQSLAGFDPPVSIAATGFMSNRSRATIYRDIKNNVLPPPTKIGRNSSFPYSIVKAYAAGQLVAATK